MCDGGDDREPGPAGEGDALRRQVMIEIAALCEPAAPVGPGEVTVSIMARAWGCPRGTAAGRLERSVRDGVLVRRVATEPRSGRECFAYKRKDTPPHSEDAGGG